jgi:hypothetical protein
LGLIGWFIYSSLKKRKQEKLNAVAALESDVNITSK